MIDLTRTGTGTSTVCITGDIDDFRDETTECLDRYFSVLRKFDIRGTFFITAKAAEDFPERVEHILKNQHIIAGHGDVHQGFYESVPVQTDRLLQMKKIFSTLFNLDIDGFRAPWYRHNADTYQALEAAGLSYDCSKKRFEIAFKGMPLFRKRYIFTRAYPVSRPVLKMLAACYNMYHNSPQIPYHITPHVTEFPTLGISDYTLIDDPRGPQFSPEDSKKIGEIWMECLRTMNQGGGGVMTLQIHPGRMSPRYLDSLDYFITNALRSEAEFSTPRDIQEKNEQ